MAPDGVLMVIALKPATIVIGAALVVALLANIALSIIIKRREARRTRPAAPALPARVQPQRIQRATANSLPEDLQERLRYLTGGDKILDEDDLDPIAPPAQPAPLDHTAPFSGSRASVVERFDSTGFLGDDMAPVAGDDRTSFFGGEDEEDATHALPLEGGQDSTHFFDAAPASDATSRFGDEPQSLRAPVPVQEDSTRFFGTVDDAAEGPSGTDFFTAGDFADISIDDDLSDGTGRLQALPAASFETLKARIDSPESDATFDDAAGFQTFDDDEQPAPAVAVPAPAAPVVSGMTGALDAVRACVATFSQPHVIAVSVLDGAGRVLAGESDADLTGELRSLMAESGEGNAASVDQAVQLQDNTVGALLLFPTGANALLGALVRDDGEGDETRASLKGLAHEIGDAMQRAS